MPLIRIDVIQGRNSEQIKALLDATHRALLAAWRIPLRDRYQIVHEHPPSHFVAEDTGLEIKRTRDCIIVQVTTRPHKREAKEAFYRLLCHELETSCGVLPSDVIVSIVANADEDWSFGNGRAQFLTGELATEVNPPADHDVGQSDGGGEHRSCA